MSYREIATGVIQRIGGAFTGNNTGNAPTMMMLGGFKFSLNTAVFQASQRSTSYSWPAQERVGQFDALQFTGPGGDRISLPGIIYPDFRGGLTQVSQLRALASRGRPLQLITAAGEILGLWVIENIEDVQDYFKPDGSFRRQEFTVNIRKFSDNADV